jgi:integrase
VEAFVKWLLQNRYSVATVNNRLSAVKKYAQLAAKAGVLPANEIALIRAVNGYGRTEGKRIDARRPVTRRGGKKAEHTPLTHEQADKLKTDHANTPQGRRDALLMCLLIDHGLRVGEVAQLRVTDFDLSSEEIRFYRSKVDRQQKHKLSQDTLQTTAAYFQHDAPAAGRLLLGSLKNGRLTSTPMSDRSMTRRVCVLGDRLGIEKLSAHDCRHYWATYWAGRVDTFRLQEAGGWSSLSMPRRYTEWAKVANEGMIQ